MSGQRVIVRGYTDVIYKRALLHIAGRTVFVCTSDAYEAIGRETDSDTRKDKLPIIGFPIEDVFDASQTAETTECQWEVALSLAKKMGSERIEKSIRVARAVRRRGRRAALGRDHPRTND